MAVTNKCQFPHDLSFAVKQLEAEIGNRLIANQELLKAAEALLPDMGGLVDEGNAILDELLAKNGAGTTTASDIVTSADVATQYGLLPDNPTQEEEEKFVGNAGTILFDRIIYMSGAQSDNPKDSTNIQILRRLYFAVGKDLKKVESILNDSTKTVFIHDQLNLKVVPAKDKGKIYSIVQIRDLLQQPQINSEDVAYTSDQRAVVILKNFLLQDTPKSTTLNITKIPPYQLISNIFHLDGVDTSTSALQRYTSMGYAGEELNSIMLGQDFIDTNAITIINKVDSLHQDASNLIDFIGFIQSRINSTFFSKSDIDKMYSDLRIALDALMNNHQSLICMLKFEVSLYLIKDILTKLREKHSDNG